MEKHSHRLSIRLTDAEYKALSFEAKSLGYSRGKLIRELIRLGHFNLTELLSKYRITSRGTMKMSNYKALNKLDAIYPILYRTSNNLNQIARAEHTKGHFDINPGTLSDLKKSLDKTYSIVKEVLK